MSKDISDKLPISIILERGGKILISINRFEPFRPENFIGEVWTIWRGPTKKKWWNLGSNGVDGEEDQDPRSLRLATVDIGSIFFACTLAGEEQSISGEEKLRRLKETNCIRLDARFGQAFWRQPDHRALEFIRTKHKITQFDLPGTVLRSPWGSREVVFFSWKLKDSGYGDAGSWEMRTLDLEKKWEPIPYDYYDFSSWGTQTPELFPSALYPL